MIMNIQDLNNELNELERALAGKQSKYSEYNRMESGKQYFIEEAKKEKYIKQIKTLKFLVRKISKIERSSYSVFKHLEVCDGKKEYWFHCNKRNVDFKLTFTDILEF